MSEEKGNDKSKRGCERPILKKLVFQNKDCLLCFFCGSTYVPKQNNLCVPLISMSNSPTIDPAPGKVKG